MPLPLCLVLLSVIYPPGQNYSAFQDNYLHISRMWSDYDTTFLWIIPVIPILESCLHCLNLSYRGKDARVVFAVVMIVHP
jgi:hypothetical protein